MTRDHTSTRSLWSPLGSTVFRALWLATFGASVGGWMQTVGAQWLLVHEDGAETLVALVQTASLVPVLLLALPAGALADIFDKRRLLLAVQLVLMTVGGFLTVRTALGHVPADLLLILTLLFGAGQAFSAPTVLAVIPELVDQRDLPAASALGGIAQNLARTVGPALAGLLAARGNLTLVFGANTLSLALFAAMLWWWRWRDAKEGAVPERFTGAVRSGGRYVRFSPIVRRILLRLALFATPTSALWALLPLVASRSLHLGPDGYGILLAAIGVGAILGAFVLPRVLARLTANVVHAISALAVGAALVTVSLATWLPVVIALVAAGAAWVTVISSVNASLQVYLPVWIRGRGLAVYQMVLAAALGLGSLVWGVLAELAGLGIVHLVAAALIVAGAATIPRWPLRDISGLRQSPAVFWAEPSLTVEPGPADGPVLITARYTVADERQAEFIEAMETVRRGRQRSGAMRWGLFREGEPPNRLVEVYQVPSWEEHLRQHGGRMTATDMEIDQRAQALTDEAVVSHLLPTRPPPRHRRTR